MSNQIVKTKSFYSAFETIFVPTFITLLPIVFFLKIGWILGHAGITKTLSIITLASVICIITSLSLSTMATNIKIESGGVYFFLSRTFGLDIGAAISLPLFLAQTLGSTFYTLACAEIMRYFLPSVSPQLVTFFLFGIVSLLSFLPSKFALKTQIAIFTMLCLALVNFYFGIYQSPIDLKIDSNVKNLSFWPLFAVFFPIVTGIEASLNFSNRLKNPARSIPNGFLFAILSALSIYLLAAYLLYIHGSRLELVSNPLIMEKVSFIPFVMIVSMALSALNAASGCVFSAASTLQAYSSDGIFPKKLFSKALSTIFVLFLSFTFAGLKNLDTIAPLLSTFFLIGYGMLNIASGIEAFIENPSWRPGFSTPWPISITCAILCFCIMMMIDPGISLFSILIISLLYLMVKKRHLQSSWEDLRYSILLYFSRYAIHKLKDLPATPRTWRPNLLVFVGDPLLRFHLTNLSAAITHRKGFLTFSSILPTTYEDRLDQEEDKFKLFLEKTKIPALVKIKMSPNILSGVKSLIDNLGLSSIVPNTIVLGASEKKEKEPIFSEIIRHVNKSKKNLILVREQGLTGQLAKKERLHERKSIDVWWGGKTTSNSELMLVLAYMLQTSKEWKGSIVTLKTIVQSKEELEDAKSAMDALVNLSRLHVETEAVLQNNDIFQTIQNHSQGKDLIFLGIRAPLSEESLEEYSHYYSNLLLKTKEFPPIAYVLSGESLEFKKILIS